MSRRKPKAPPVREEGPIDPGAVLRDVGAIVREVDALLHAVGVAAVDLPAGPTSLRVQLLLGVAERLTEEARARADRWLERAER